MWLLKYARISVNREWQIFSRLLRFFWRVLQIMRGSEVCIKKETIYLKALNVVNKWFVSRYIFLSAFNSVLLLPPLFSTLHLNFHRLNLRQKRAANAYHLFCVLKRIPHLLDRFQSSNLCKSIELLMPPVNHKSIKWLVKAHQALDHIRDGKALLLLNRKVVQLLTSCSWLMSWDRVPKMSLLQMAGSNNY